MSKKDYIRLAEAFHDALNRAHHVDYPTWRLCVHLTANTLQAENWKFDRQKFYRACGLQEEQESQGSFL